MEIFNARKKEYKSVIGAVCEKEEVRLRIVLPRELQCSAAFLAVHKDGESTVRYSMFWAGLCGEGSESWQLHFSAETCGLYFYHFEIDTPWGRNFIQNTGRGRAEITNAGGDFQQTVYETGFEVPDFLQGGILYQIFPDRFYKSGETKHGVPKTRVLRKWGEEPFWHESQMGGLWNNDYFGGDLKGIEEKLEYLSGLGVSCIYLNPIFEANSNHRYDTADYEKIDTLLGGEKSFRSLCRSAKAHGIAIVLDGVFSHTGCDSKYFNLYSHYASPGAANSKDSPYYGWYKFKHYPDDYESWWGIKLLPEVDETNESFQKYICGEDGIARKWLRLGASGWRLDVADELPDLFLDEMRKAVKAENKNAVIIGEVWEDASNKISYSHRRRYLLGRQLDSVMNYPFAEAIFDFVCRGGADAFFDKIMSVVENYPKRCLDILMNHIGTHDTERALNRLAGERAEGKPRQWQHEHNRLSARQYAEGVRRLKLASLIQFTLPGVPSIYYGDEAGAVGMADPFNRACFDWENMDEELLLWYRQLGKIRRGTPAFKDGEFEIFHAKGDVIAYKRTAAESEVLVAVNNAIESAEIPVGAEWNSAECLLGTAAQPGRLCLAPGGFSLLAKKDK